MFFSVDGASMFQLTTGSVVPRDVQGNEITGTALYGVDIPPVGNGGGRFPMQRVKQKQGTLVN